MRNEKNVESGQERQEQDPAQVEMERHERLAAMLRQGYQPTEPLNYSPPGLNRPRR